MKLNPYQPSVSATVESDEAPLLGPIEKICLAPVVVLVVASVYHYTLIEDLELYRSSMCVGVKVVALLISILCAVLHFARFTSFCYLGKFRQAVVSLCASIATVAVSAWAMWYDAPAFMSAT